MIFFVFLMYCIKKNFCFEERRFIFEGYDEGFFFSIKLFEFEFGDDGVGFDDIDEVFFFVNVDLIVIEGYDYRFEVFIFVVNYFYRRYIVR